MSFLREPDSEPIPGYRLIEPLGSGGFGEVWKCEAPGGIFKAIKFVYGNLNALDSDSARAEQELNALHRVKEVRHPFVLSMDRIEVVAGELVIVMELADKSLHDAFTESLAAGLTGVPRDTLLRYIRDAAEALDHMIERHNLLHLDVKPRNLFLVSDRVKVADFGLVKHLGRSSASGILAGVTPLYAPPETFLNKINEHSDQYSLAIVYQELLTGQRPFAGKNARQLALQHMNAEPELRLLPEAERSIVGRALSKDPAKRFPNCLAFVRALYNARSILPAGTVETGARPKTLHDTMEDILLEQGSSPSPEVIPPILPEEDALEEVSDLGLTVAQPATGALRPTLVIGLGAFGRRALMELRCRLIDRFGDLSRIPLIRFLYVDTDPDAVRMANRGAPEVALTGNDICPLPLQPVGNYRRRMLDHLNDWLPREKLYAVPRSLHTQGIRALGRLAFTDNHLRFLARLRRELQQAAHPDSIYQSVSQTGLALRDNVPRVYLITAAGGGSSGMLPDLGYSLKRLLQQLRSPEAEILSFVYCGAPTDPATPRAELANVYATLTELHHYSDPAVPFAAQYGADGPRIADQGPPFNTVYLLQQAHRSPEGLRDSVAHLGSFIFHDLTTPLGLRLERGRQESRSPDASPFRSFGTYAVWFPRGLLLRLAARQACARLLVDWQAPDEPTAVAEVEAACAKALSDPGLRFEAVCNRIEALAQIPNEGPPAQALTGLLARLEEQSQQSVAMDDPGNWARQALTRVRDWVGVGLTSEVESDWRRSRLHRAFGEATHQIANEWDQLLTGAAFGLMEHPGHRVAAAEVALSRFIRFCQEAHATHRARLNQQAPLIQRAWDQVAEALERCLGGTGGFSFFGGRTRRLLRVFIDHLAAFTRQRLTEDIIAAGLHFYAILQGKLEDQLRELTFCRQRLRHLQETFEAPEEEMETLAAARGMDTARRGPETISDGSPAPSTESFWEQIRHSATVRVVLPDGELDLGRAADRFVASLTLEQWTQLDTDLQDQVLAGLGGLHAACVGSGDVLRNLARPLIDQTAATLGELLPVTDVAEVEFSAATGVADIHARVRQYHASAAPLIPEKGNEKEEMFLLVPASDAGKAFGEEAKSTLADVHIVKVPGQADLMFCREQGPLTLEGLQGMLRLCRAAYLETMPVPHQSAHARFDVVDWTPLDP